MLCGIQPPKLVNFKVDLCHTGFKQADFPRHMLMHNLKKSYFPPYPQEESGRLLLSSYET
jgi:hypothetical protein